jgi:hypothetical protein
MHSALMFPGLGEQCGTIVYTLRIGLVLVRLKVDSSEVYKIKEIQVKKAFSRDI